MVLLLLMMFAFCAAWALHAGSTSRGIRLSRSARLRAGRRAMLTLAQWVVKTPGVSPNCQWRDNASISTNFSI